MLGDTLGPHGPVSSISGFAAEAGGPWTATAAAGLVDLMIDMDLGVSTVAKYELKRIDTDFFDQG